MIEFRYESYAIECSTIAENEIQIPQKLGHRNVLIFNQTPSNGWEIHRIANGLVVIFYWLFYRIMENGTVILTVELK